MLDTIMDNYSKTVESTLRMQQEMLRQWTDQWSPFGSQAMGFTLAGLSNSSRAALTAAWLEPFNAARRKWADLVIDILHRHREALNEQYRAWIRILEDASRVGEARDLEQFRRLSEELWWRSLHTLGTAVTSQMRDVQAVQQRWFQVACEGVKGPFERLQIRS